MQAPNSLQIFEANRWLERTGIECHIVDMQPLPHGYTHRNDLLTLQQGEQIVLRRYLHRAAIPARKERGFFSLLRHQVSVPAPRVFGILSTDDAAALVLEYVPGSLLGDAAASLSEQAYDEVHASVGTTLRRIHTITYRQGGMLIGEDMAPFVEGSWAGHLLADVKKSTQVLSEHRLMNRTVATAIIERYTAATSLLNSHVPTLVHGDYHPWNLLVAKEEHRWSVRAVLDMESAIAGDPEYDLARFLTVRLGPYPEVPASFFEAYGRRPDPVRFELYSMAMLLSAARVKSAGTAISAYMGERALEFVKQLPERLGLS